MALKFKILCRNKTGYIYRVGPGANVIGVDFLKNTLRFVTYFFSTRKMLVTSMSSIPLFMNLGLKMLCISLQGASFPTDRNNLKVVRNKKWN